MDPQERKADGEGSLNPSISKQKTASLQTLQKPQ